MPKPNNVPLKLLFDGIGSTDIQLLKDWGEYLVIESEGKKKMATTQLRKFFGEVKRLQATGVLRDVILLEPKMAYAVGRAIKENKGNDNLKISDFYKCLSPLIRAIDQDKAKFKNFVNIYEAIVAYHKAAGGE